jgi:hypothetical protein
MRFLLHISIPLLLGTAVFGQESGKVKTDKIEGIICANVSDWKLMVTAKEIWTPTREEVLKAEEKVEDHLKNNPLSYAADLWRQLPDYKRQYVGIIVGGHKRIFCNFFCWTERPLTEKPVFVLDGGECFFRIEYDLEDKKCYNFNANGYASMTLASRPSPKTS